MNASTSPSPEPVSDDALERSLREYFRSKMPSQFPPLTLAEPARSPAPGRNALLSHSRIVLAVCASALLLALWFLLGQNSPDRGTPIRGMQDTSATNRPIFSKSPAAAPGNQPAK